jgi:hypothetical protein
MQDRAEQLWLATVKMVLEAKRGGVEVGKTLSLLRNARAMLNEGRLDNGFLELTVEAEMMIEEAQEEIFMATASTPLFKEKWEEVISRVQRGEQIGDYSMAPNTFRPGLPRDGKWVRLPFNGTLSVSKARKVAAEHGLDFRLHGEKHFILLGDRTRIKQALETLSKYYRGG